METFKTLQILKNPSNNCPRRLNKRWKPISKKLLRKEILRDFQSITFPEKGLQLRHSKFEKESEKCHFQKLRPFVFELKALDSKPFSKMLPIAKFKFKDFALLSQRIISTLLLKNLQNTKKLNFFTLETLKRFSKLFSIILTSYDELRI